MTADEVRAWAEQAAECDLRNHKKRGTPLNPYGTAPAQEAWRQGFANHAKPGFILNPAHCTRFQRGRAMALLLAKESAAGRSPANQS